MTEMNNQTNNTQTQKETTLNQSSQNAQGQDKPKFDHEAIRQQKLQMMHKGPCSSPMLENNGDDCPCVHDCPLHGRCCDCIAHHKQERMEAAEAGTAQAGDFHWIPQCLLWFDNLNGIDTEKDPDCILKFYKSMDPNFPIRGEK